jgi:hypothetical protein
MANTPKSVRKYRAVNEAAGKAAGTKKEPALYAKAAKAENKVYAGAKKPKATTGVAPAPKSAGPKKVK